MSYYDPFNGLNEDTRVGGGTTRGGGGFNAGSTIADRMYKRLHEDSGQSSAPSARSAQASKGPKIARPPVALMCYLCGQQFGTASLEIHQKQCYTKKLLQWERGDPETRGPKPQLRTQQEPKQITDGINDSRSINGMGGSVGGSSSSNGMGGGGGAFAGMTAKQIEQFNNNQFQEFQTASLVPCENCGRTFFPDRLQVHLRSCKPGASARPVRKVSDTAASPLGPNHASASANHYDSKPLPKRASTGVHTSNGSHEPSPREQVRKRSTEEKAPAPQGYMDDTDRFGGGDYVEETFDEALLSFEQQQASLRKASQSEASRATPTTSNASCNGRGGDDAASFEDSPAGGHHNAPVIPHLHLGSRSDNNPSSPLEDEEGALGDAFNEDRCEAGSRGGDVDGDSGGGFMGEEGPASPPQMMETLSTPTASKKPKVAIDRPLDLSHVQSRFKASAAVSNLERCQYCNRTFAPDRLAKHEDVCLEKKKAGGPIGMTPRVGGGGSGLLRGGVNDSASMRPLSSQGLSTTTRSGATTSRTVASSGYGKVVDNSGPLTTRGGGGASKIIRPANASSRPQSPSATRPASRSPPPGVRSSIDRGASVSGNASGSTRPAPSKIIQPAAGHPSPSSSARLGGPAVDSEAPAPAVKPKFCTECGTRLYQASQRFCGECGHRLDGL